MSTMRLPVSGLHRWNEHDDIAPAATSPMRFWLVPAMALLALVLIGATGANAPLFLAINGMAGGLPDSLWACITSLGDTLPAFAILLPLASRRSDAAAAALIAVLLAMLASQGLKHGLDISRPFAILDQGLFHAVGPRLSGRSFPSGHTTAAFTVAALIGGHSLPLRKWLPVLLGAAMIGLSRIAVGAHWPADVLSGAVVGWLSGFAGLHLAPYCRFCQSKAMHWLTLALFAAGTVWLLTSFQSGYLDARWLERTVALSSLLVFSLSLFGKRVLPLSRP
jgi:membrane-associated phospholipid phosphatase